MRKWGERKFTKPKIGKDSLHQDSDNNGVGTVNFATQKIFLLITLCSPIVTFINTPGALRGGATRTTQQPLNTSHRIN
jgi:hypothetical protein